MLKDETVADEITQEVFFRLWINHKSLDETISYNSYFYTIAKNIVMDLYRKKKVEMDYQKDQKQTQILETSSDAASRINYSDLQEAINRAIDKMPSQQQFIFRLSREVGLRNMEIAEKLKISKRTVEKHISNSLKVLKKIVRNNYIIIFL